MKDRIGIYARISLDRSGGGQGVERQQQDNRALAEQRGWIVADEYTDNSLSAYKDDISRPEFERLLEDLKSGAIDGFVAWKVDRITRQLRDLVRLMDIHKKRGFFIATVMDGELDMDQVLLNALRFADAEQSSQYTSVRVKRKILANAQAGIPHNGPRAYGYQKDQTKLDPIEAPIVREMGLKFIAGLSAREIAWQLNERGTLTRAGKPWYPDQIKKHISRPRNAGFQVIQGQRFNGKWERIFSDEEWDDLQRMIERRKQNLKFRPSNRRYLLTGLVHCGRCGGFLYGMSKRSSPTCSINPTYQCRVQSETQRHTEACGGMCIQATPLNHFIREVVCERLDGPLLAEVLAAQSNDREAVRALLSQRDSAAARKTDFINDYADGTLDRAGLRQATARVDATIADIDRQINDARRDHLKLDLTPGETLREAWDRNPDGWRRELIEVLIERIDIAKSTKKPLYKIEGHTFRFDPGRVTIAWKL